MQLTAGPAALAAIGKAERLARQLKTHYARQAMRARASADSQGDAAAAAAAAAATAFDPDGRAPAQATAAGVAGGDGKAPRAASAPVPVAKDADLKDSDVGGTGGADRVPTRLFGPLAEPDLPIASFWLRNVLGIPIEFCISDR